MREYKVGDKVTIRSWESMEREFGSCIDVPGMFVDEMREMCGNTTRISSVVCDGRYTIADAYHYHYAPQMFTDWETDNAKGMKMQYNGQEVELITEGYWPEGVTLIYSDDGKDWCARTNCVCLAKKMAFSTDFVSVAGGWRYWAIKPTKPAPRRLTNREVANLCKKGWDTADGEWIYLHWDYKKEYENDPTPQGVTLRAPNSDEWVEPTSDLLEVGK